MAFVRASAIAASLTLFDRDAELEHLSVAMSRAEERAGAVILVEGEAGIGKSALLAAAGVLGEERGMRVLSGRGGELESGFGFGLMRQLLESELAASSAERHERLLSGAAAFASAVLEPGPGPEGSGEQREPFALQHGLYWLLSNLAEEQALLVLLDDLHWADMATLRFLVYLARRLEELPVALVGSVRLGDSRARSRPLELLRADPLVESIEPAPLSEESVAVIAGEALVSEDAREVARACHEVSGGNPFLLSELILTLMSEGREGQGALERHIRDAGPPSVSRSVGQRIAGTSEQGIALAEAIAVLGSDVKLHHAARLAGLSESAALAAAEQLIEARVLAPGRRFGFRHPLLRTAVYADLAGPRRAHLHKRAARLLARDGEGVDAVAGQIMLSEPAGDEWVVQSLCAAAAGALARTAPEAAASYLGRALVEPPPASERARILSMLGSARFHSGDPAGLEVLAEAFALSEEPRQRALIALELGSLLYFFGDIPKAVDLMEGAAAGLEPSDTLAQQLDDMLLAIAGLDISTHELVQRRLDAAMEDLPGDDAHERLLLAIVALHVSCGQGTASGATSIARRAIGGGKLFAEQPWYAAPVLFPVDALIFSDEFEGAAAAIDQLFEQARRRGSLVSFSMASWARGWLSHRMGALHDAASDLRISWRKGREAGWEDATALGTGLLIEALVDAGDIAAAEAVLDDVDESFHDASTSVARLFILEGRGRLRLAQENASGALEDFLELGCLCDAWGWTNPAHHPWRSAAAVASTQIGDRSAAQALAQDEVELAERFGAPRATANALRVLGLIEGGSTGVELLQRAAALLEASGAQLVKAEVLVELGAALRRARQRAAAREPLRAGLALADRCGAKSLAERAQVELQATGARPRSLMLVGADALTPSERRVCDLVAKGHSNPEVAQHLFVTRGTVEAHLRSAYRKLHISSRTQLGQALLGRQHQEKPGAA
jgi:DNA-binding CsgD family transcriptional regulator